MAYICQNGYTTVIVFVIVNLLFQETTALSEEMLSSVPMTPIIIGLGKCKTIPNLFISLSSMCVYSFPKFMSLHNILLQERMLIGAADTT